ncbi:SpoIID/LytB domain-containing protein [Flindersiella endophytica]
MRGMTVFLICALLLFFSAPAAAAGAPADQPGFEVAARPAGGKYQLAGHGWGHGRGMSQYGAYAAARTGAGYREILKFYYPGTKLSGLPDATIRVRLSHNGSPVRIRPERGLQVWWTYQNGALRHATLPSTFKGCPYSMWRVSKSGSSDLRLDGYACGRWHTRIKPSQVLGSGRISFIPPDDTIGVERRASGGSAARRAYRGAIRVVLKGGKLRAINIVSYDKYLRSVVPAESPSWWPPSALQAQAVAARSYAARSARNNSGRYFDVYDTTASQAYPGWVKFTSKWKVATVYEAGRTSKAINATRGKVLVHSKAIALTEFGSSNGGWTASGQVPYLPARKDGWDPRKDPNHNWSGSVTVSRLEKRYPSIGKLKEIRVGKRTGHGDWGGRVTELRIVGTKKTKVVRGEDGVRNALGVKSAWFKIR